jgi:hypothetical protein
VAASFMLLLALVFAMREQSGRTVRSFDLSTVAGVEPAAEHIFISEPFSLGQGGTGQAALDFTLVTSVRNSWLGVDAALINEDDGTAYEFGVEAAYYAGYEDGESWSEGSQSSSVTVPEVRAGRYVLRIEPSWQVMPLAMPYRVVLRHGVSRPGYGVLLVLVMGIFPLITWVRLRSFEQRRKEDMEE